MKRYFDLRPGSCDATKYGRRCVARVRENRGRWRESQDLSAGIFFHARMPAINGDWCWFTTGSFPARLLGLPLISCIEEMGRMVSV